MIKKSKGSVPKKSIEQLSLPTEKTIISNELSDYIWLIYGERKIGKTTLLSQFEDVFFLMFDPLNKGLDVYQRYCRTWGDFLKYIKLLEDNPGYCKMIVIDTGYMAYEKCYDYKCKELNISDPRDKAWGNAWKAIGKEFINAHERILDLGLGLAVTAHSEVREIQHRDGTSYNKLTTQLGGQAFKYYNGLVDVIAYYQYTPKGDRELLIRGNSLVEAGTRIQKHFFYTDGTHVDAINMGGTHEQAYINLTKAFDNVLVKPKMKEGTIKKKKIIRRIK